MCHMDGSTFKDWLADTLRSSGVSQRELARRLAAGPTDSDPESSRRTISRILSGRVSPTDKTRRSIGDALNDDSWPNEASEAVDEATEREMQLEQAWTVIRTLALGGK